VCILCHKHKSIVILIEGEMFVNCTVTRKMYTSKMNEIGLIILSFAFQVLALICSKYISQNLLTKYKFLLKIPKLWLCCEKHPLQIRGPKH